MNDHLQSYKIENPQRTRIKRIVFFVLFIHLFIFGSRIIKGQEGFTGDSAIHRLTLYVMKSIKPIDWNSPASLYKTVRKGYISHIFRKNQFLLGHLAVRIESPLVKNPIYYGMVSSSNKEKRRMVRKEKIGLGILGAGLQGHLETGDTVMNEIKKYSRLGKVAFVRYLISEEAVKRISFFLEKFRSTSNGDISPSRIYGGVFWPRYENEGAGCTAFGMAILDLAGLLAQEQAGWKVNVKIPMDLIGGDFNGNHKISKKAIVRSNSWYAGNPDSVNNFVPFWIYDPSIIFDWVLKQRETHDNRGGGNYHPIMENEIPGLISDRKYVKPSLSDPVFIKRTEPSVFIERFNRKRDISPEIR